MSKTIKELGRGDRAPHFATNDIAQSSFDLSEHTGGPMWLAFYRYASCPMCNIHFDDVASRREQFAKYGMKFVAIFESNAENFPVRLITHRNDDVRVLADPSCTLYHLYKVQQRLSALFKPDVLEAAIDAGRRRMKPGKVDGSLLRVPAHFLILPGGIIHTAHYGNSVADHLKWRDLEPFLETLTRLNSYQKTEG